MKVTIRRYGSWVTDRVNLRNVLPAPVYSEKCWITPDTDNIPEPPPHRAADDSTSVVGVPLTADDSTSVVGEQNTTLKRGMYAVIPATCWADILRDGYEFGYGKCSTHSRKRFNKSTNLLERVFWSRLVWGGPEGPARGTSQVSGVLLGVLFSMLTNNRRMPE